MREPTRRCRGGALALVLGGALLLAACSSGGSGSSGSPASSGAGSGSTAAGATSTNAITISNFMFSPMSASVAPGSTISVTNNDPVAHTLSATGGQFDTGDIDGGQTKTFTAPSKA